MSNLVIEKKLLGGIFLSASAFNRLHQYLRAEVFEDKIHQAIFTEMAKLYAANKPVKRELVAQALGDQVEGVDTETYLSALTHAALDDDTLPLEDFADALREDWIRRDAHEMLRKASDSFSNKSFRVDDLLSKVRARVELLSSSDDAFKTITLQEAMDGCVDDIEERAMSGGVVGYDTGVPFIQELTGNWVPGQYIIIGAQTKMGKSALAIDAALGLSVCGPVLYFSFEMKANAIASRRLATLTGLSTKEQRDLDPSHHHFGKLKSAKSKVMGASNFHMISRKFTIEQIFDFARAKKAEFGSLAAVVVDHLGLLRPMKGGSRKDYEIAAEASPFMKEMSEELNCVAVGLSQLTKDAPWGRDFSAKIKDCQKPPNHFQLKGSIAEDADHVLMPYRTEAMLSNIEPARGTDDFMKWEQAMIAAKNKGIVRLSLSREAQPKIIPVYWDGVKTQFQTMKQEQEYSLMGSDF